jgi:hypothetical protein
LSTRVDRRKLEELNRQILGDPPEATSMTPSSSSPKTEPKDIEAMEGGSKVKEEEEEREEEEEEEEEVPECLRQASDEEMLDPSDCEDDDDDL